MSRLNPVMLAATAAAAALVCMNAQAQSSVTIFGIIDNGFGYLSASGAGHASGMVTGGSTTPRLGFRGTEDLGGGLAASFWLESQLNGDTGGGLDFARRSTVSLAGRFGEIRLGRDLTPTYLSMVAFDAWAQRGLGTVEYPGPVLAGVSSYFRNSNSVGYFLPLDLGGFYGSAQYAFSEQASARTGVPLSTASAAAPTTDKTGSYAGARFGYSKGPVDVAVAYGKFFDALRTAAGTPAQYYAGDYTIGNIGASYDFGFIKPILLVQRERMDGRAAVGDFGLNTFSLGATAPLGAGVLRAAFSQYDRRGSDNDYRKFTVGYLYSLSKSTTLYVDVSRIGNDGANTGTFGGLGGSVPSPIPTAGGHATGFTTGIKHTF